MLLLLGARPVLSPVLSYFAHLCPLTWGKGLGFYPYLAQRMGVMGQSSEPGWVVAARMGRGNGGLAPPYPPSPPWVFVMAAAWWIPARCLAEWSSLLPGTKLSQDSQGQKVTDEDPRAPRGQAFITWLSSSGARAEPKCLAPKPVTPGASDSPAACSLCFHGDSRLPLPSLLIPDEARGSQPP